MDALQTSLKNMIQEDFNLSHLEQLLSPAPFYTGNDIFKSHFKEIVQILTQDRDLDRKFTLNDLQLFVKDILAMTNFITIVLLILNSIPNIKIDYTEGETEQLVFKLLVYIFLVILPHYTNITFSTDEKMALYNIALLAYLSLIESQLLKKLVIKVSKWFKIKIANCFNNQSVIDNKLPVLQENLNTIIKNKL